MVKVVRLAAAIVIPVLLVGIFFVVGLVSSGERQGPSRASGKGEPREVVIEMTTRNWRFDPTVVLAHAEVEGSSKSKNEFFADTVIKVKQGDVVIMKIRNVEPNQPHGFGLEEFGIFAVIPPQETVTIKFVASKEGTYTFFCTVFCGTGHPFHKGTLIVSGG